MNQSKQPEALRLAYEIGANLIKFQPTEEERLRFEQWMAGHCWKIGGTWDGTTYRGAEELGDYLDVQALHTRQLFAAWRDCAALRDQLDGSKAQRAPLTDAEIESATGAKQGTPLFLAAKGFTIAIERAHGIGKETK